MNCPDCGDPLPPGGYSEHHEKVLQEMRVLLHDANKKEEIITPEIRAVVRVAKEIYDAPNDAKCDLAVARIHNAVLALRRAEEKEK